MLFDLPLAEGTPKVVFPLKIYQCEPTPAMLRRDIAHFVESVATLPEPVQESSPEDLDTEPVPVADEPPAAEPASQDAQPPQQSVQQESAGQDEQVDRVMSKLSERLPDVIRAILQEERGGQN